MSCAIRFTDYISGAFRGALRCNMPLNCSGVDGFVIIAPNNPWRDPRLFCAKPHIQWVSVREAFIACSYVSMIMDG